MYDLTKLPSVAAALSAFERDCAITVALKISDDSCKMDEDEKALFISLYENIRKCESELFDETVYSLIEIACNTPSSFVFGEIRELREMAMDAITRPRMKAFKRSVREKLSRPSSA